MSNEGISRVGLEFPLRSSVKAFFPPVTNQTLHICTVLKGHSCLLDQNDAANKMVILVLITELRKLIERLVRILQ